MDAATIHQYDSLGRPKWKEQRFKVNGGNWLPGYTMERDYNLAGGVITQAYPSGRIAQYEYDSAGRLSLFKGELGDSALRNYADAITYQPSGQMSKEHFSTTNNSNTGLNHLMSYNSRLQVTRIGLGTDPANLTSPSHGWLNFFYTQSAASAAGTNANVSDSGTDNNGNVRVAQHKVPVGNPVVIRTVQHDIYNYDALNQLQQVIGSQFPGNGSQYPQYNQTFDYDRWGNRSINQTTTNHPSINRFPCQADATSNRFGVCTGYAFQYDNAGNVTYDPTGAGTSNYDAENRLIAASGLQSSGTTGGQYVYNAEGQRTRFRLNIYAAQPKWKFYIYGFDGELLTEYPLQALPGSPETEYGYRAGERLIVATGSSGPSGGSSVSLPVGNGGFETPPVGSRNYQLNPSGANWTFTGVSDVSGNGSPISGNAASPEGAQAAFLQGGSESVVSQLVSGFDASRSYQLSFQAARAGKSEERRETPATADFEVFIDNLSLGVYQLSSAAYASFTTRRFAAPLGKGTIRFVGHNAAGNVAIALLDNVQLIGLPVGTNNADVRWMVADHLGTPRMIVKLSGLLSDVTRHDYLPFGEELLPSNLWPLRNTGTGYSGDNVRQKFGSKERDIETGLDFLGARYFASVQGRFTSADPLYIEMARLSDPQQLNNYSYARNNPLRFIDPTGLDITVTGTEQEDYLKRLQQNLSFKTQINAKTNKVEVVDANGSALDQKALKALGKTLKGGEKELFNAITDTKNHVTIDTLRGDANVDFGRFDGKGRNTIDAADLDLLDAPKNAGGLSSAQVVGHETLEAYAAAKTGATNPADPHDYANRYFGGLGPLDPSTVRYAGYPGPISQILRVSFEMPIHNGGGARARVTREFLTPIPENAIPKGHIPAHIIDVEKKP